MEVFTHPLAQIQQIAMDIVGLVAWTGLEGYCKCPGIAKHTTANALTDCKVVVEPIGERKPGVYCFHGSCKEEVDAASFQLRSALGKHSPSAEALARSKRSGKKRPAPSEFDPATLERLARKLDGADDQWFAARSPKRPDNRTSASFLRALYKPGERVIVFDRLMSQGQHVWTCTQSPFDARELDGFRTGKREGVWFQCNPASGKYADTGTFNKDGSAHLSRRSWRTVTSWRYLVLESDQANPAHWLAALAQMPLPIAAIYTSGGKSIHALVALNAASKSEWDETAASLKPMMLTLGADPKAISAVRLTRLPGCERVEKRQMQTLLYLNGTPDLMPIAEMPVVAPGWTEFEPADQDGFNVEAAP